MRFHPAVLASLLSLCGALFLQKAQQIDVFQSRLQIPIVDPESFLRFAKAPLHAPNDVDGKAPGRFIVVLKDDLTPGQVAAFKSLFLLLHAVLTADMPVKPDLPEFFSIRTFNGVASYLSPLLLDATRSDSRVRFVENDETIHLAKVPHTLEIQSDATWGLHRISHREDSEGNPLEYLHDASGGAGVNVYVLDSGIKVEHPQFEGRAMWGIAINPPHDEIDHQGHGTHIAGIIGSFEYGVSKKVNLISVGVLSAAGNTSPSKFVIGLEWIVKDHEKRMAAHENGFRGLVINISLGNKKNLAVDMAVDLAIDAGLHVATCAGNDNDDACEYSPARAMGPITVGSLGPGDTVGALSNTGICVDVFAPGVDIKSTFTSSDTTIKSGTLMATGFVSGLLAYFLSIAPESVVADIDPNNLKERFLKFATANKMKGLPNDGSPNLIAFNGAGGSLADFWND